MANKKKEVYRPGPMTEGKRNIIQGLLQEYDIQSATDIQEALKDDSRFEELVLLGCKVLGDCKVFSRSNYDSKVKHIETGVKVLL